MAQIIEVPLSVEFVSQRRAWEVYWYEIAGFSHEFLPKGALSPIGSISGRKDLAIRVYRKNLRGMLGRTLRESEGQDPFTLQGSNANEYLNERFVASDGKITAPENEIYRQYEIVVCFSQSKGKPRKRDPWEMREEFLRLKNTNSALTQFLNKWGDWDSSFLVEIPFRSLLFGEQARPMFVIPELVWERQQFYRTAMQTSAEDWMANHGRVPTPRRISTHPFFQATDSTCSMAIETTITMDKLRDIPYRLCALESCGLPFRLKTKHEKLYCSSKCAHHASVRKGREAERVAKTKLGGKESHVNLQAR